MSGRLGTTVDRARGVLSGFTPGQRGVVAVAAIALVLGAFGLTQWVARPSLTPLYGNLSGADANAIVEQLRTDNVPYQLADGGATVLVPQGQVYDLRVSLSGKGLPAGDANGYSLLDKQGITATDFQQNVAYRRALEGELDKTLEAMDGVRTAVVHLAIPKRDVFATEQDKPTAAVLLSLATGTALDRDQVRAITHLVAGSVEGLDPNDVTVTDSTGRLLSVTEDGVAGAAAAASDSDQQTAQYEDRLSSAVQQMLDRVLGPGNSTVRVNAVLNFDSRDTTSERYVSETAPPLSEATVAETYNAGGSGAGGPVGVTIPSLVPTGGASGNGAYNRQQRTVNNAVGKIVERSQASPGQVKRLTVAVAVDATSAGAANPAQIQQMVANAVGLDSTRGDVIQVDKVPFDATAKKTAATELQQAEKAAKTAGYLQMGKKAGIVLLLLLVAFFMLRRPKSEKGATVEATASDLPSEGLVLPQMPAAIAAGPPALTPDEQALTRDRLRDEVAELVDNQPDEVAQMLQGWLSERKG